MSASPVRISDHTGGPFGVCAAIGADFGFNPDILRLSLAAGLLWNPLAMMAGYGLAALIMVAGRRLFPDIGPVGAIVPEAPAIADHEVPVEQRAFVPERLAA